MKCSLILLLSVVITSCSGPLPLSEVDGPWVPVGPDQLLVDWLPSGRLSSGGDGPNAAISSANLAQVMEQVSGVLSYVMSQAMALNTDSVPFGPVERRLGEDGAILDGIFSAELAGRVYTYTADFTAELRDMSIDRQQYFGGGLRIKMVFKNTVGTIDGFSRNAEIDGVLELGGTYRGKLILIGIETVSSAWAGRFKGDVIIKVNGVETRKYVEKSSHYHSNNTGWIIN